MSVNLWDRPEHARAYLEKRKQWPWREQAYGALMEWVPGSARLVLDLGCGDGEVTGRVRKAVADATVLAVDFSPEMLQRATERFADDDAVEVLHHDLDDPLPAEWGRFDLVVSAFAIHHVVDERKRALYREVHELLEPGGSFLNLEHVDSATAELHQAFLEAVGETDEDDPSNKLVLVETQLAWLHEIGFVQVDCHYKWRELALLAAMRA